MMSAEDAKDGIHSVGLPSLPFISRNIFDRA